MKRSEFEQILDNSRKLLLNATNLEALLKVELDDFCCNYLCNIINTLADSTKAMWDDELWGKVYDYNIPTSTLIQSIEEYSIKDRKAKGEEGVIVFDPE